MSLWDMALSQLVGAFYRWLVVIDHLTSSVRSEAGDYKARVDEALKELKPLCVRFDLDESADCIDRILTNTPNDLPPKLEALRDLIESEASKRHVYAISRRKGDALRDGVLSPDWDAIIEAFDVGDDVGSACLCMAVDEHNASIFHLMRVAEMGLRAFARERGVRSLTHKGKPKPLEWGQWQEILNKVEDSVDAVEKKLRPGPAKDAAMSFYRGTLGHYHAFKDVYRNQIMHVRGNYNEHDAARAMFQVREFMRVLATKIDGKNPRPIKWSASEASRP